MGQLTLAEMKEEVRANFGNRADLTDARITRALNRAQRIMVTGKGKFLELERRNDLVIAATTEETSFSLLSADLHKLYSIVNLTYNETGYKVDYVPNNKWDRFTPTPSQVTEGWIIFYTMWEKTFEWYQIPSVAQTLRIRWSTWPTLLLDSMPGAVSDLDNKDDAIMSMASNLLFISLGRGDKAKIYWAMYKEFYDNNIKEDNDKPDAIITGMPATDRTPSEYWADPFVRSVP